MGYFVANSANDTTYVAGVAPGTVDGFFGGDAKTFAVIDKAYLPQNIPWPAHGMHFPEAKFTVTNNK